MSQISKAVRVAALARISDPVTGLNANLKAEIATGAYGDAEAFIVDWSSDSPQVFLADLHPDDIDESTPSTYPMFMLFTKGSANQAMEKFRLFAGVVGLVLKIHLTTLSTQAYGAVHLEDMADAVEAAIYTTFDPITQTWPGNVLCGLVSVSRDSVEPLGGEGQRKTITVSVPFEIFTN